MATFQMNFLSRLLGMMTNLSVILPSLAPSDAVNERQSTYTPGIKYQTLWLLHDYTGDDGDFIRFSNIVRYAQVNKLAVIMPCEYNKMYTDAPESSQFFRYITEELPQLCRAFFPLSGRCEDNFIGGVGMGATGALKAALRCPDQYATVLALDGGLGAPKESWLAELKAQGKIIPLAPDGVPDEEFDLTIPAQRNAQKQKTLPKIIMASSGKDAPFAAGFQSDAALLGGCGYDVQTKEVAGSDWDFYDEALRQAVECWLPLRRSAMLDQVQEG